jgi:hypothetical protein
LLLLFPNFQFLGKIKLLKQNCEIKDFKQMIIVLSII